MKKDNLHEIEQEVELLKYVLDKGPNKIVSDHEKLQAVINAMIRTSKLSAKEIADASELTPTQYHRRKNNPKLWTADELRKLFRVFKFKK